MRALFLIAASILLAGPAAAQIRSVSHSVWVISGDQVTVRVELSAAGLASMTNEKWAAYVASHVGVDAAGAPCAAVDQGYDIGRINSLAVGTGLIGFEIIFHCPNAGLPTLRNALLFERAPQHIDYARIEWKAKILEQLFTVDRQVIEVDDSLHSAGLSAYARVGAAHSLHSWKRMCFLLGLLLLLRTKRDLTVAAGGLCVGYVLASLIPLAQIIPHSPALESIVGLLVALCAACWVALQVRDNHWLASGIGATLLLLGTAVSTVNHAIDWTLFGAAIFAGCFLPFVTRHRAAPLFVLPSLFGMLDGLVLWGDFSQLHLWQGLKSVTLLSFNLGALALELGIMALLYAGVAWWTRSGSRAAFNSVAGDFTATALAGLGAFWLLFQLKN